ncbi:phosphoglycerate mutase family protein [Shewanella hanedai]|jgi:broad specificity phosphatase PhoE|uniref:Histidine phosphatase family protein n=1 Tax=Shewanella hanedai TaxID=25 RepID=A0A553JLJ9_SHEHA|nr:phosphoglycerate mutase family protein [Shewanella hanedai]TRY13280.1 histidine phosphatase family protein [Shewanella hanedai]
MIKKLLFPIMLGLFFSATLQAAEAEIQGADSNSKILIFVRHAEKQLDQGKDPSLTPAGQRRATQLAIALKDMPFTALYATPFKRTKETLEPISKNKEITVQVVDVKGGMSEHISRSVEKIKAEKGNVLVVGHSNTIPLLIKAIGGMEIDAIAENDYDNLYLLTLPAKGSVGLIHTKYGQ